MINQSSNVRRILQDFGTDIAHLGAGSAYMIASTRLQTLGISQPEINRLLSLEDGPAERQSGGACHHTDAQSGLCLVILFCLTTLAFAQKAYASIGVTASNEGPEQSNFTRRNVSFIHPYGRWPAILGCGVGTRRVITSNFDNEPSLVGLVIEPHPVISSPDELRVDCFDQFCGPLNIIFGGAGRFPGLVAGFEKRSGRFSF